MEITADGARCFRCSQAAAIDQHNANSAAQLEGHNRTVVAMSGWQFWNVEFHCAQCNTELDGAPGLFSLSLPPPTIACPKCGRAFVLTFWHRARWLSSVILRVGFLVVLAIRHQALRDALPRAVDVAVQLLLSFGIALGIAVVLTLPAVLLMRRRPPAP
jgi:DNA-directed RNA polymerase subunit RPC12/RpoP